MGDDNLQGLADADLDLASSKSDEENKKKKEKKEKKKAEESMETGVPEPKERYRALTDLLDTYNDISEMADKKTRFALVILGAMNTVNLLVVARPEILLGEQMLKDPFILVYLVAYVSLSLFLFAQAIGTLKPRVATLLKKLDGSDPVLQRTAGLRLISQVSDMDFDEYYEKWRTASYAEINREIALSVQMVARVLRSKYQALNRLYSGLMVLVFFSASLILYVGYLRTFK